MSVSVSKDGAVVTLATEDGYTLTLDGSSWGRGTRSGRYREHRASGRTRESFSGAIHDDAVHVFGIVIQSPTTPYTPQQVAMKLDDLEAVMDTGGRITVTTGEGTTHSVIENVEMSEPRHEFLKGRAEVTYTLTCRPYWHGPATLAAIPVTANATADTHINSRFTTANYGMLSWFATGYFYGTGQDSATNRSLLRFTKSREGTTILRLYPYAFGSAAGGTSLTVYNLRRTDWEELEATWNRYKADNDWTTAGAGSTTDDYHATPTATYTFPATPAAGWIEIDVTALVGTTTGQIDLLVMGDESISDTRAWFYSREYDSASHAPHIITQVTTLDLEPLPDSFALESGGDIDALTSIGLAAVDATTGMILSACVTESEDYEPLHDFAGSADASALGGAVKVTNVGTDWTDIAETAALDSQVYKGRYIVHARTSCASEIELRAVSRVIGSGMAGVTDQPSEVATVAASGFRDSVLLPVEIPASRVPGIESGSGFGAESTILDTTASSTLVSAAAVEQSYQCPLNVLADDITHSVSPHVYVETRSAGTPATITATLWRWAGRAWIYGTGRTEDVTVYDGAFELEVPENLRTARIWRLDVKVTQGSVPAVADKHIGFYTGAANTGATITTATPDTAEGDTPKMTALGRVALGFDCKVALQAKVATSTADVSADYLMLHPTDRGGCTLYNDESAAGQGMLVDCLSHRRNEWRVYAYADDGTTIGANAALKVRSFPSPPRVWPGRTVIAASVFTAAAPGDGVLRVSSTPRYLDASRAL